MADQQDEKQRDQDVEEMFRKAQQMHAELFEKTGLLYDILPRKRKEFADYFDNPANFSKQQWAEISQIKAKKEELLQKLGQKTKAEVEKKKSIEADAGRKGKTLGFRKKWLQM